MIKKGWRMIWQERFFAVWTIIGVIKIITLSVNVIVKLIEAALDMR